MADGGWFPIDAKRRRVRLDLILEKLPRSHKQSSHELVAAVLREAITAGVLQANQPLPQDEIAAQLRVSHIPVREALRQLQSEGLVSYQANRGATVTALTPDEIKEIYEIRVILETAAIRQAAPRLAEATLAEAGRRLDAAERATESSLWGTLDVDFHRLVYALDGRPRLDELITGLLRRVDRYWTLQGLMLTHRDTFDREHRAILEALQHRDGEGAARILEHHLAGAARLLIGEMRRSASPELQAAL
jgi:DNA-binding GntR family transcriptional regulator